MRYYDLNEKTGRMDSRSCFDKMQAYQWQREWRICLWSHNMRNEPITLEIGDISDIACVVPANRISSELASYYGEYSVVKELEGAGTETYTTISNGNVISKLMSKYSGIQVCQFRRSDKAEALKCLSKYYELLGELDEAEETLKKLIETEKSWDNYDLLIAFYMRTKKYDQAEKIYLDIVKNNLDLIEDKESFFWAIHQFFMHFQKPYDASIVYSLWSKKIFSEEMALSVQHDIYVGLGMSDKAIEIADVLKEKYGNKEILAYYYALNYLYLLDLKKARLYLNKYNEKYSPDLRQNRCVSAIEDKLNILDGKRNIVVDEYITAGLRQICPTPEEVCKLKEQIKEICIMEDITLYAIFKTNSEECLTRCKKILVTAKTMHQLIDTYCVTGDKYLYKIIQFIKEDPRVSIQSPTLETLMYNSLDSEDDLTMLMTKSLAKEVELTLKCMKDKKC